MDRKQLKRRPRIIPSLLPIAIRAKPVDVIEKACDKVNDVLNKLRFRSKRKTLTQNTPKPGTQNYTAPSPGTQNYTAPSPGTQNYTAPSPGTQNYTAANTGGTKNASPQNLNPHMRPTTAGERAENDHMTQVDNPVPQTRPDAATDSDDDVMVQRAPASGVEEELEGKEPRALLDHQTMPGSETLDVCAYCTFSFIVPNVVFCSIA